MAAGPETLRPLPVSTVSEVCAALALYDADPRRPLSDDQVRDLGLNYRMAFRAMLNGGATEERWSICVCSLNIALVLAERGLGEEYIPRINEALAGAFRAKVRAGSIGSWGFDGPAIQAIKDAFDVHDEQLTLATKNETRAALHEVHRRADEGNVYQEAA